MKPHENGDDMDKGTIKDYVQHRLRVAEENLEDAKLLHEKGRYRAANNRAYYAIFHAICTVHALDGKGYKSHKQAIGNFNMNYIRTGIFPREFGHQIAKAQEKRHSSDYDYGFVPTEQET